MDILSNQAGGAESAGAGAEARAAATALGNAKQGRGGYRPGSGRKPAAAPREGAGSGAAAPPVDETPHASPADIEFCRETAKSVLKVVDRFITGRVEKVVLSIDPIQFKVLAGQMVSQVSISDQEIDFVGNSVGALAAKYPGLTAFAPELALGGWVVSYSLRVYSTLDEIKKLAREVMAARPRPQSEPVP